MLEKIRMAIRPFTDDKMFILKKVVYGTYNSEYVIELESKEISLFFKGLNVTRYPGIRCSFYIPSIKKFFNDEYLFAAMGIDIPLSRTQNKFHLEFMENNFSRDYAQVSELEVLDFYEDLDRLIKDLQKNWKKIQFIFSPDAINETIQKYSVEYHKRLPTKRVFWDIYPIEEYYGKKDRLLQRDMPNFPEVLFTIRSLNTLFQRDTITFDIEHDLIDITCYSIDIPSWKIVFHEEETGSTGVYFVLYPEGAYPKIRTDLQKSGIRIIFSSGNLFKLLGIRPIKMSKGFLEDIMEYAQIIKENFSIISTALSLEKIDETYDLLKDTPGNNNIEINRLLNSLIDLTG